MIRAVLECAHEKSTTENWYNDHFGPTFTGRVKRTLERSYRVHRGS
jgi:hypothetical protein